MMKIVKCAVAGLVLGSAFFSTAAQAAVITWGSATDVNTVADVSLNGTLVEAFNLRQTNSTGTLTVNGVVFQNINTLLTGVSYNPDTFSGDTGDADYNTLLSQMDIGGGQNQSLSIGGGSLVSGTVYELQIWYSQTAEPSNGSFVMDFGDGLGNAVSLTASGQYAVGTFTADGSSQTLSLVTTDAGHGQFNGYQLRAVAVPEPSTIALVMGVLVLGLSLVRRRFK